MAYNEYLKTVMNNKTKIKVFLSNKTMLTGLVKEFDEDSIVLDRCLVMREQIISIDYESK